MQPLQEVDLDGRQHRAAVRSSDKLTQSKHKILLQQSSGAMVERTYSFMSQQVHVIITKELTVTGVPSNVRESCLSLQ